MILVTGATGFVGGSLLRELLKKGYGVRCLVRDVERGLRLKELGCELKRGDIRELNSVVEALDKNTDTVIHLVGILAEARGSTYRDIHVAGTSNVITACKMRGVRRVIHMSALGARPNARSRYHRTKWEAEELVRNSGLEYTIFRPSVIFGSADRFTNMFARFVRMFPVVFVPGSGGNLMQPVFVEDLSRMMRESIVRKDAAGKTYEVAGPERLTFDEIIDRIAQTLGRRVLKVHIPLVLMKPGALLAEMLFSKPPLSRDALLMLEEDNVTDDDSIERVFGIKRTGFTEGMKGYLH